MYDDRDPGTEPMPAVQWDIRREGRAWTADEALSRYELTPEKLLGLVRLPIKPEFPAQFLDSGRLDLVSERVPHGFEKALGVLGRAEQVSSFNKTRELRCRDHRDVLASPSSSLARLARAWL
jgi:hypothetical protein